MPNEEPEKPVSAVLSATVSVENVGAVKVKPNPTKAFGKAVHATINLSGAKDGEASTTTHTFPGTVTNPGILVIQADPLSAGEGDKLVKNAPGPVEFVLLKDNESTDTDSLKYQLLDTPHVVAGSFCATVLKDAKAVAFKNNLNRTVTLELILAHGAPPPSRPAPKNGDADSIGSPPAAVETPKSQPDTASQSTEDPKPVDTEATRTLRGKK